MYKIEIWEDIAAKQSRLNQQKDLKLEQWFKAHMKNTEVDCMKEN
jgi:hypothetical protein